MKTTCSQCKRTIHVARDMAVNPVCFACANPPPPKKTPPSIDKINSTPMGELRFSEFARLKCGRDSYSSMRRDQLLSHIPGVELQQVMSQLTDERLQDAAIRWCLRGLTVDKAIRKVKTDEEVTMNAIQAHNKRLWAEKLVEEK